MKEKVGFIGLGNMGKPMAFNLLKAGYALVVCDLNPAPVQELVAAGAESAPDPRTLGAGVEMVITILPADRQVFEVYHGGLLDALKPGSTCIEMTSALPDTVKEIGKEALAKGVTMLDAPVSGGVARAVDGSLTIMVGGDAGVFECCKPVLQAMGKVIHYTGELGSGKAVKMINQFLNAGNTAVASEAVYLAERMGLDMDTVTRVVGESSGASWVFSNTAAKAIIPRNFKPGFRLDLMAKDVGLSMDYARQNHIVLPVMSLIQQVYQSMLNQGHAADAYSVISQWTKQQNQEGIAKMYDVIKNFPRPDKALWKRWERSNRQLCTSRWGNAARCRTLLCQSDICIAPSYLFDEKKKILAF